MKKYRFDEIAFNSTEKKKPTEADKDTYLGLEHLDSGCLTVSRFGSEVAPIGEKLVMKKGDVLFGKRRAYQKKVAIAPFDGIFSAHGMVLRPKCNVIDPDFFPVFISSDYFLDAAIKISVGSLSPTINWRDLKELEFELPDLKEQKRLAGVLNSINRTREAYKKLLFLTDQLVKSQFMEMFGDPVTNSLKWPAEKMRIVAPAVSYSGNVPECEGKSWLLNLDMIESNSGRIIEKSMVKISDIGSSTIAFSNENVLFSKLRPYLNKIALPNEVGYATSELIPLLPDKTKVIKQFLASLLRGDRFLSFIRTHVAGTKMPRVSMSVFWNFEVILPPLSLQEHFVEIIEQSDKSKHLLEICPFF